MEKHSETYLSSNNLRLKIKKKYWELQQTRRLTLLASHSLELFHKHENTLEIISSLYLVRMVIREGI